MKAPINSQLSLSKQFVMAVWRVLKPIGYKRNGNTFIYTGKEVKTIVHIQTGKFSTKNDAYSFINISYANAKKEVKTFNDANFYHFRHDSFGSSGFIQMGSSDRCEFPCDLEYKNEGEMQKAIDILKIIEPIFRLETFKEIEDTYKSKLNPSVWDSVFNRLIS